MKSYVEPLNAEEALEVLKKYDIPCDNARAIGGGAVNVDGIYGTVTCDTPGELAAAIGGDASLALETHKAFRLEAIRSYLEPALANKDWIYNIGSTRTIIPSLNEKGELQGMLSCYGDYASDLARSILKGNLPDSETLLKDYLGSRILRLPLSEENVVQRPPRDLTSPVNDAEFQETIEMALSKLESSIDLSDANPIGYQLEREGWTLGNEQSITQALSVHDYLQSYTHPLTASGAVEVLKMYGISPECSESHEKFGAVEVQIGAEPKSIETPMELAQALGEKAVSALEAHETFRSRILNEVINPCVYGSDWKSNKYLASYNVKTGETNIAINDCGYYFPGFRSAVIPLQELLERSESGQPFNARLTFFSKFSNDLSGTTFIEDYVSLAPRYEGFSELTSDFSSAVNDILNKMEVEAIEQSSDGLPDFETSGWCIGDREHIIETCERVGFDIDFSRLPEAEESLDDMARAAESALEENKESDLEGEHEEEIPF